MHTTLHISTYHIYLFFMHFLGGIFFRKKYKKLKTT
jgi:hypothetical protein